MLVIHNKIEMFELVLSMSSPKLLNIKNNKGIFLTAALNSGQ